MTIAEQPCTFSSAELMGYLRCHGTSGESVIVPPQRESEVATLLAECLAREADLIIAGAFTRYRTDHPTFGSMTQAMIMQRQIPVSIMDRFYSAGRRQARRWSKSR
jgi:hypothetical protein